ncbi:hypothetical protein HBE96_25625 [Clostridium sp. P21]|uniref:Uncharacterized protein n=1 Tax=Clostridium muellerianum TaxID=2716538 RepID=A0A7Y0EM85_9CLOT|nr:hypothetical protein [Clostridium muellerianum]NMM65961.1 hypothetical protein [Clostridium muellerianum]
MKSTMIFENTIPKVNPTETYMIKIKAFSIRSNTLSSLQVIPKVKNVVNSFCLHFIKEIYIKIFHNAVLNTAIDGSIKMLSCIDTIA